MAQLSLTVLRCPDYGAAEQRPVRGVELTIGRGTECDWALPDPLRSLSRKHCRLEQVGAAWQVVDLSANGTFINFDSEPIGRDQAQALRDGDRLRLGDYELEVRLAQPTAPGLGSPFGAGTPSDLGARLSPGLADNAGLGAEADDSLFAAVPRSGGLGSAPVSGGFGSARLPGLDDPVAPESAGDALDLDISGGLGSFSPAPTFGPQDDHAAATGDAFIPPAVAPRSAPAPAALQAGGQPIVPDDWLQSLALGTPAPAGIEPDFALPPATSTWSPVAAPAVVSGVASASRPAASPADASAFATPSSTPFSEPWPASVPKSDQAAVVDPFQGDPSPWTGAAPLPFDDPAPGADGAAAAAGPDAAAVPAGGGSTRPGATAPAWQPPVDVPLSGPGPGRGQALAATGAHERVAVPAVPPAVVRPAAPLALATAGTSAPGGADADALRAALATFVAGGGLPPEAVQRAAQDPEAALRHAGALMQAAVAGLRALLVARGLVKREFRIEQTMLRPKENNPLKFAASDEHALASLLDPRMGGLKAVQDAVDDLSSHEVAVLAATQAAAHALLEKLSPAALEADDPGGSGLFGASAEKRLWLAYKRRHATLMAQLEDDFDSAFGIAFARAYEQAVGKRKG